MSIISSVVLELASFLQKKYSATYSVIRLNRNKSNWANDLNSMATIVRKWSFCGPQACIFIKKVTLAQVISRKFCEISKNTFFHRIALAAAFVAIHRFTIPIWLYCLIWWQSKKGRGTKELEQLKHLSLKIQEVASIVAITVKNEKLSDANYRETAGTQKAFSDKITFNIDGFTDEPFFQCNVQVVENTFVL